MMLLYRINLWNQPMELSQLQAFVSVAQNSSFSITAEQLHLTQPAISKRISSLEQQLNCELFHRLSHQVQLTETGKCLFPKAIKILQDVEDCKRFLQQLDGKVAGKLTIASSHHIGLHRLPEILKSYAKKYPEVELGFQFLESEQACEAVRLGKIELAVITLPLEQDEKLLTSKLWNDPLYCMVNDDHVMNNISPMTMEKLVSYPMLLPTKQTYTTQIIEQPFLNKNLKLNTSMTANDLESLRMLVEIGLGWSILPSSMLRPPLKIIPVKELKLSRNLGLVRHRDRSLSSSAKAMISLLESSRNFNN
ncbi:MAG: LysR family transcriptional regulator [Gammaproteobacteria bacterium]|nr:MAG: LysR family transcriptional regulator [Gammaproteobacteria bacterium]